MDIVHPQPNTVARSGNLLARLLSALGWRQRRGPVSDDSVRPAFAEKFRTLALEISARAATRPLRTILVMSAYPGDGRTLTVAHLGIALARLGNRVTLVEAEAHRPDLARLFEVTMGQGSISRFPGVAAAAVTPTHIEGLDLALPEAVGSALADANLVANALKMHRASADFVLLDSPPCRDAGDAFFLAPLVDGVVFVVRHRQQEIDTLRDIRARLDRLGVYVIGAVYNDKG